MIIYSTKETIKQFNIKMSQSLPYPKNEAAQAIIDREGSDDLLKWSAKYFEFDGKKCMQIMNMASMFTLFLMDVGKVELHYIGNMMANYMHDIYENDAEMLSAIEKMFEKTGGVCHTALNDTNVLMMMTQIQLKFALNGRRFYDYVENGVLKTAEINKTFNRGWPVRISVDGVDEEFVPADKFRELMIARFAE